MLGFAFGTIDHAGSKVVGLFRDGMSTALETLFASEPELVSWRESFASCDGIFVRGAGVFASSERSSFSSNLRICFFCLGRCRVRACLLCYSAW